MDSDIINTDSESGNELSSTQLVEEETSKIVSLNSLPERSKKVYKAAYELFMEWRRKKEIDSFSESTFLLYFTELSEKYKPSSMWAHYSMIRSTLDLYQGINIESYSKLRALLKTKSQGFRPKQVSTFSPENITEFLTKAPDNIFLPIKVALVMGVMGACRCNELYSMKIDDIQDLGTVYLVSVPNARTKVTRKFTVTDSFYLICKKYISSRPPHGSTSALFLNYINGRCSTLRIGINKFTKMGKEIAKFLKLSNPENYSGHSFRRSSALLFVDTCGVITAINRQNIGKSIARSMTESEVDNSEDNFVKIEKDTTENISSSTVENNVNETPYESSKSISNKDNQSINLDASSLSTINLTNCSNITININK